ncbi:carboxypeptidase regulatory-like domain-containing protein [Chloroflexota bacterium]
MVAIPIRAGDVFLTDGEDGAKDYVEYGAPGQSNESIAGGSQWPAGDYVPGVLQGQSIGRGDNGHDTNKSSDWQTFASPTMGAMNAGGDSFSPDSVTNVVLADNDSVSFGLDGQDVTVTWTPATTTDETFDKYIIYILPAATELDMAGQTPFAHVYGGQSMSSFSASPARTKDSAGNNLVGGSYKAYVVAVDWALNKSTAVASAAATLIAETSTQAGEDDDPPMIMSMPVWMAKEGSNIIILAQVHDNRALDSTTPTQLKWRVSGGGAFTPVDGVEIVANTGIYRYAIPWNGSWNISTQIDYYLVAKDAAGKYSYFTTNPAFDTAPTSHDAADDAMAATFSFLVKINPAASYNRTISGTVYDDAGAPLAQTGVVIHGSGLDVVITGVSGNYSFTVPDGNYSVAAKKPGYREGMIEGISVNEHNTTSTGNDFYLTEGSSGMGGDAEKAFIRWTDPSDGMMGAPIDINLNAAPIVAHMSEPMDSSTIIDNNATDAGSNVFLTTTGQDRVTGQVTYNDSDSTDPKIIFYSTTPLNKGTGYYFVITSKVTDMAGNPIEGNQPDGRFVSEFTTFSDAAGGDYGRGVAFPPFVMGSMPAPGSFNVPIDTKINVTFSEAMDPVTIEFSNSTGLNLRLYDPDYQGSGTGQYVSLASVTLDDATSTVATLTVSQTDNLTGNHHYEIRVLGGAKSSKGIYMADPAQTGFESQVVFRAEFDTGAGVDTSGAPRIVGTNLEMYRTSASGNISTSGTLVDVPVNLGVIEIGFNKDIDSTTVTRNTVTLKTGTISVKGSVNYKSMDRVATFNPSQALNPNTTYTLRIVGGSSGIADTVGGAGHYLAADYYAVFTTSSQADAEPPFITHAKASDFKAIIHFSEPMNAARKTNTTQWPTSVLNPANYTLYTDTGPPETDPTGSPYTGNNVSSGNLGEAEGLAFAYDSGTSTVIIKGLQLSPMGGFRIWVNNVTDLSSNTIDGNINAPDTSGFGRNAAGGPIGDSAAGGVMEPGGKGMMGPTGSGTNMGQMGMMPIGVFPMSMIAGATTTYMIDMPLNRAITANGTIVLTFPSGFDISGAKNADPNGEWAHKDINGPGPGIVVLSSANEITQSGGLNNDGVVINSSARTVTITLGAVGTAGYQSGNITTDDKDFLHLEIAGIKNSNIPKSFETSGYTVDIQTMAGGSLLESLTSMPFFIMPAGQYTISGTITFPNNITTAVGDPVDVFGGSPMVGPIEVEVTFSNNASAGYSITGLPAGEYHLMTEPMVIISSGVGDGEYFGSGNPEPIRIDDSTTTGGVYNKNFSFTSSSGKPALTVQIVGNFSGDKAGDVDIFAGSPSGHSVKTVSLSANYTAQSPFSTTLYLPGNGTYRVGMGPAMPKGQMSMGSTSMPKWTPPPSFEVRYDGASWVETSGTPNDGTVLFTVGTGLAVPGYVYDGAGNPIPNAEVYAYSAMGMFGTHDSTLPDGSFTLYLPEGMYKVGAFLPGMPNSVEFGIDVRVVSGQTKIYVDGVETASLVIKVAKPDRTISGKVTDGTNTVTGASVYAYRTNGPGHAETMTDSSGVYILYVTPGTWNVGAFLPGYGPLPEKTGIEVTTSDVSNINLFPDVSTDYVRISGNVSIGGAVQTYIPIRAVEIAADGTFTGYENGASTDGNGNYSIKVKGTSSGEKHYRVDIWTPEYGEIEANSGSGVTNAPTRAQPWNVAVTTTDVTNVNIDVDATDLKTLTITFDGGSATMTAYVDVMRIDPTTTQPLDMGKHFEIKDLSATTTVDLPAGAYHGFAHIPGYGEFIPIEGQGPPYYLDLTSDTTATFDLGGGGEATVAGTVYDGQGNPVADAFVHIGNPQTGMDFGAPANSSGNYSLSIKPGTYMMGAEKPGYTGSPITITVTSGANNQDLTITRTTLTISGYVYVDSNSNGSYDAGEGLSSGFVHAQKLGGGSANTPTDPDGSYALYVSSGDWRLTGVADGYQEKEYTGNPVAVTGSSVSGINILLSGTVSLKPPRAQPFRPASGATFNDRNAGLKITVPPMAAGSGTSDFQVQGRETSNIPSTPTAKPLGRKGQNITVFDANGNPLNTLDNDITIEITYTKAELEDAGIVSMEQISRIKLAYWDGSASAYVAIPTTIAYDPASQTTWTNLVSVTFKAVTRHLSVFSPIVPSDGLAPATPTSLVATAGNGQVALSWTAPTTSADGTALTDLLGYEIYRATSAGGTYSQVNTTDVTTNSYSDTSVSNGTTYYYQVTTADTGGNESVKSGASSGVTPVAPESESSGSGGGGGGGGGGGAPAGFTSVFDYVTSEGKFTKEVTAKSDDGNVEIVISKNTIGKRSSGIALSSMRIREMTTGLPTVPADSHVISLVYDITPDGTTFDQPVDLTFSYNESMIPQGFTEKNLVVVTWDKSTSLWVELESVIDLDANTITAKVSHFTAFTIMARSRPASFVASALSIRPAEVDVGRSVSISALVTNTGDLSGTYEVVLKINDAVLETKQVTLAGDESQTVSFSVTRSVVGEYTVDINGLTGTFKAKEHQALAATFTINTLSISPTEVNTGESIIIAVTVTNRGELTGTYAVALKVNDVAVETREATLAGGASQQVEFKVTEDIAGTYRIDVNGLLDTFTVRGELVITPAEPTIPPPVTESATTTTLPEKEPFNWGLVGGIVAISIIVVGLLVYFFWWRKRGTTMVS